MFKQKVPCRHCHRTDAIKKHGTARSGYQRYLCGACGRTFQVKYIYQAYKLNEEKKHQSAARPKEINIVSVAKNNIVHF